MCSFKTDQEKSLDIVTVCWRSSNSHVGSKACHLYRGKSGRIRKSFQEQTFFSCSQDIKRCGEVNSADSQADFFQDIVLEESHFKSSLLFESRQKKWRKAKCQKLETRDGLSIFIRLSPSFRM